MKYWTSDEIKFLQDNLNVNTKTLYTYFVNCFGIARSYDSVQKQVKKLRDSFQDEEAVKTDGVSLASLQDAFNNQYDSILEDIKELGLDEEEEPSTSVKQWVQQVIASTKPKDYTKYIHKVSGKSTLVLLLTDLHFGKITPTFNMEEAKRRLLSITKSLLAASMPEIDEIVVVLAGDLIEGEDIYPAQGIHLDDPAIIQIKVATKTIWQLLLDLRVSFDVLVRVITVPGNHGRTSKNVDKRSNWDNIIYQTLGLMAEVSDPEGIDIQVNLEWLNFFYVKDKKGLAYHYGVKHLGTPAMQVKIGGWINTRQIDFIVKGHHHHFEIPTYLGRPMISNGSMCGPDDYSEELALDEPARQAWFVITPGEPIKDFHFIQWG